MVISSPKHRISPSAYSPFTFVLSENVFRQGTVVLLNLVYGMFYFLECFMFIRAT